MKNTILTKQLPCDLLKGMSEQNIYKHSSLKYYNLFVGTIYSNYSTCLPVLNPFKTTKRRKTKTPI